MTEIVIFILGFALGIFTGVGVVIVALANMTISR